MAATPNVMAAEGPSTEAPSQPPAHLPPPPTGPFALALALAALAGWVDAAGLSGPGAMFVSFMSGNTTQGALALARHDWHRTAEVLGVIGAFVTGVTAGETLANHVGRDGSAAVLLLEAAILAAAAALRARILAVAPWSEDCVLAAAMGLQNATMHRSAGMNVSLTYITGTLVQLGRSLAARLDGAGGGNAPRFASLWLALAGGAAGCGLVLSFSRLLALAAAAGVAAILGLIALVPGLRR